MPHDVLHVSNLWEGNTHMNAPRKQGPWGLWWLTGITFSIYYFVWYARINREFSTILGHDVPANGRWWNQLIPFWNLVGLAKTAGRLNAAHAAMGSPTRVGSFMTWFLAPAWFGSQTRYLQRRINILHDVIASHSVTAGRTAAQPATFMSEPQMVAQPPVTNN